MKALPIVGKHEKLIEGNMQNVFKIILKWCKKERVRDTVSI